MLKPPTGEPCAGEPHARFGGQGGRKPFLTPIAENNIYNILEPVSAVVIGIQLKSLAIMRSGPAPLLGSHPASRCGEGPAAMVEKHGGQLGAQLFPTCCIILRLTHRHRLGILGVQNCNFLPALHASA